MAHASLLDQATGCAVVQGASRGIGAALAEALLADDGVTTLVATSRAPEGSPALQRLVTQHGERCRLIPMDVEREASIAEGARRIGEIVGATDAVRVVVNCAGLLHEGDVQPEKRLEDLRAESLMRSFAVNAVGPALVARYLQPLFAREGRSLFASISARVGSIGDNRLGGWYGYRAAKAAQNMFTRTLSIEFARRLPECVCVGLHPGTVATDLSAPFSKGVPAERLFSPAYAAARLIEVLRGLTTDDSGACFAWDGQRIDP